MKKTMAIVAMMALCVAALCMLTACQKAENKAAAASEAFTNSGLTDQSATSTAVSSTVATTVTAVSAATSTESTTSQSTTTAEAAATTTSATTPVTTGSGVVCIDAGHQAHGDSGQEPVGPGASETKARVSDGAAGVSTGIDESEINLEVALKLQAALEARGITVIMVRTSQDVDISNAERAAVANGANADLFIRLHCDGVDDSSVNGFLTLVPGVNEWTGGIVDSSAAAADIIHPMVIAATGATDRGIVERTDLSGFNWCTVPTVLFEMGCMSNPEEDEKLASDSYQQAIANAMAEGTVAYLATR